VVTYCTVTPVVADDWQRNAQLLFTYDCTHGVSDTLYHSRYYSRDKH